MPPSDDQRLDDSPRDATVTSPAAHVKAAPPAPAPSRPSEPALPPAPAAAKPKPMRGSLVPPSPATARRAVAGLFLALLSLAGLLGLSGYRHGIYVVLYAMLAGAAALWFSVTALTRARRERTARPRGVVTATVIAAIGILLSGALLAVFVVLGKQLSTYGQCLAGANTISAQQACKDQFSRAVDHEIPVLRSGAHR